VVLPFIVFPLVWICSDKQVMTVKNPSQDVPEVPSREQDILEANSTREIEIDQERAIPSRQMSSTSLEMKGKTYEEEPAYVLSTNEDVPGPHAGQSETSNEPKQMSFASHWTVTVLGYALFGVVTLANAYVLVMLMMGK
jgi:metal iron transporter